MLQRLKPAFRLLSLFLALSVFSIVYAGSGLRSADAETIRPHPAAFCLADYGISEAAEIVTDEELLSAGIQRITHSHHPKGLNQHKNAVFFLSSSPFFLFAGLALRGAVLRIETCTFYSRKYIIKYMHDQDGPKE